MRSLAAGVAAALCLGGLAAGAPRPTPTPNTGAGTVSGSGLAGRVVVLDPGHQLGNRHRLDEINTPVDAGGFRKPCNTTGSATPDGLAEATFAWSVGLLVKERLEARGVRVILTRSSNSDDRWGPCVDVRGRQGNTLADGGPADLKISIHGDGCDGCGAGFHVIAPAPRAGWTDDIAADSLAFAKELRAALRDAGLPYAPYTAGGDGLALRGDLGTLNWSDIPTVMVELGNMRAPADAHRMADATGRRVYADAIARAVVLRLT